MRLQHAARAWRQVGSTEQVLFGGVRSIHSSGWTGAAAGARDQRASSEDSAFVKARRAYQAELHDLRKTFTQDVAKAQAQRQQKADALRKAHDERIWSEKALRDAEKAKRAAANVAAQHEMMLQKVQERLERRKRYAARMDEEAAWKAKQRKWLEDRSVSWIQDEVTLARRVVAALKNPQMLEQ